MGRETQNPSRSKELRSSVLEFISSVFNLPAFTNDLHRAAIFVFDFVTTETNLESVELSGISKACTKMFVARYSDDAAQSESKEEAQADFRLLYWVTLCNALTSPSVSEAQVGKYHLSIQNTFSHIPYCIPYVCACLLAHAHKYKFASMWARTCTQHVAGISRLH